MIDFFLIIGEFIREKSHTNVKFVENDLLLAAIFIIIE